MTKEKELRKLLELINKVRFDIGMEEVTKISPEMKFKEGLEIDSISLEELVVYVEEAFNVELDIEIIKNVDDILQVINK